MVKQRREPNTLPYQSCSIYALSSPTEGKHRTLTGGQISGYHSPESCPFGKFIGKVLKGRLNLHWLCT